MSATPVSNPTDELRFSALFEQAAAGLAELDVDGRFTLVNDTFCTMVGRSREELLATRVQDITHPDDSALNSQMFGAAALLGVPYRIEKRYVRPDGGAVRVDKSVSVIRAADGVITRLLAIIQSTERREAEAIATAQTRSLEILNRTGATLASELDVDRVVQIVTDAGLALTGAEFGTFLDKGAADGDGSHALPKVPREAFEGIPMPLLERAFRDDGAFRSDDLARDPRCADLPIGALPVTSLLAVPVASRSGEMVGALLFGHSGRARFTEGHQALTTGIAAQAAVAIDNARLYQSAQREVVVRTAAETALLESEERFRLIADSAPTPIWMTGTSGFRDFVNRAYADFMGVSFERGLTFDWRDRLHPDDLGRILREQQAGEASGEQFALEARYRDARGRWRWLRSVSQPRIGPTGESLGFIGVAFDVTEAKRAEADLRQMNELLERRVAERTVALQLLYDRTPTLLHSQTPDGTLLTVSDRWLEFMGYTRDEVIGRRVTEFVPANTPDGAALTRWHELLSGDDAGATGGFDDVEYHFAKRSGEVAEVLVSGRVERDEDGRMLRMLVAMTDVTARKRAEEALLQAQKMEAVGQLTGGIAHDFNNLLTIIRSSADLLGRDTVTDERRRRYVAAIAGSAERAAVLTGQLLAFARRQPLRPEVFDLGERIEMLRPLIAAGLGARIAIRIERPRKALLIEADATQLDTAVLNLVSNARDVMPGGGTLTLRVAADEAVVHLHVADTGAGITPEALGHVFEPFFTTKEIGKGTGLGLSQVYGFVKQSGGEATAANGADGGAEFTLSLPRFGDRDEAPVESPATMPDRSLASLRVLVVEDNEEVGANAMQLLEDLGHRPTLAISAAQAFQLFGDAGEAFDVVFSDVVMSEVNGLELAAELRRRAPKIPVVLTSGYSDALIAGRGSDFELIGKPYSADQVASTLIRVAAAAG